jgi:hypothetical protein
VTTRIIIYASNEEQNQAFTTAIQLSMANHSAVIIRFPKADPMPLQIVVDWDALLPYIIPNLAKRPYHPDGRD